MLILRPNKFRLLKYRFKLVLVYFICYFSVLNMFN